MNQENTNIQNSANETEKTESVETLKLVKFKIGEAAVRDFYSMLKVRSVTN